MLYHCLQVLAGYATALQVCKHDWASVSLTHVAELARLVVVLLLLSGRAVQVAGAFGNCRFYLAVR
jgi:hypothetical protein